MTNFQGEEKLAYHGEEYFSSTPLTASLGRLAETQWSSLVVNTQAGNIFRICGLCNFFAEEKAV